MPLDKGAAYWAAAAIISSSLRWSLAKLSIPSASFSTAILFGGRGGNSQRAMGCVAGNKQQHGARLPCPWTRCCRRCHCRPPHLSLVSNLPDRTI